MLNILTWLRGFKDKIANFSRLHCPAIHRRENKTKYRKMTWKPRSHVRILKYGMWTIRNNVRTLMQGLATRIFPRNIAITPAAQFFFCKLRGLLSASFPGFSPTCPYRAREGRETRDELKTTLRTRLGYCMALKRGEKSLSHVNMVARFLVLNKAWSWKMAEKWKKLTCMIFLCLIALKNETVIHIFFHRSHANGRLCQERLLRFGNVTPDLSSIFFWRCNLWELLLHARGPKG